MSAFRNVLLVVTVLYLSYAPHASAQDISPAGKIYWRRNVQGEKFRIQFFSDHTYKATHSFETNTGVWWMSGTTLIYRKTYSSRTGFGVYNPDKYFINFNPFGYSVHQLGEPMNYLECAP